MNQCARVASMFALVFLFAFHGCSKGDGNRGFTTVAVTISNCAPSVDPITLHVGSNDTAKWVTPNALSYVVSFGQSPFVNPGPFALKQAQPAVSGQLKDSVKQTCAANPNDPVCEAKYTITSPNDPGCHNDPRVIIRP